MSLSNQNDLVAGVEKDIIEQFLELVRDKYPLVDKANYFLERQGVSGINIGITNQRDVLSHLCTILVHPERKKEDKIGQIQAAEEHLRRAIIESYHKGTTIKLEEFKNVYDEYKKIVLPLRESDAALNSAPSLTAVKASLRDVMELREKGRLAKSRNKWDAEWEDGVRALTDAFSEIVKVQEQLENYIIKARRVVVDQKRQPNQWKIAIIVGVACVGIGVLAGRFF